MLLLLQQHQVVSFILFGQGSTSSLLFTSKIQSRSSPFNVSQHYQFLPSIPHTPLSTRRRDAVSHATSALRRRATRSYIAPMLLTSCQCRKASASYPGRTSSSPEPPPTVYGLYSKSLLCIFPSHSPRKQPSATIIIHSSPVLLSSSHVVVFITMLSPPFCPFSILIMFLPFSSLFGLKAVLLLG